MAIEPLKPTSPVFRLGRRNFALETRDFKGETQMGLLEVTAVVDPKDPLIVAGWMPVFKGVRIQGSAKDFNALVVALHALLGKSA